MSAMITINFESNKNNDQSIVKRIKMKRKLLIDELALNSKMARNESPDRVAVLGYNQIAWTIACVQNTFKGTNGSNFSSYTETLNDDVKVKIFEIRQQITVFQLALKTQKERQNGLVKNGLDLCMKSWRLALGNIRALKVNSDITSRQKSLRAHIENSLKFRGFCVLDQFFDAEKCKKINTFLEDLKQDGNYQNGRLAGAKSATKSRADLVCWLEDQQKSCKEIEELKEFCDTIIAHEDISQDRCITMATKVKLKFLICYLQS